LNPKDAMIGSEHTQSLSSFREKAVETLDRVNQTGEAEIITVDGEARGVLLSPAVYDDLARQAQLSRDVAMIRRSVKDIDEGKFLEAGVYFDGLREKVLAMKAAQEMNHP
jgi:PHD/YefM family antitoxin component YafN of YafNO toxin-antitoxin module